MSRREKYEARPHSIDGRNIEPAIGTLMGEGSLQRVRKVDAPPHGEFGSAGVIPSENEGTSYYGLPLLKEPVWKWYVPAYFYIGGLSGACSALGASAALIDRKRLSSLSRICDLTALGGAGLSAVLLIADLGRPMRFLNMLRVLRPSSPMNVGSWILSAFGAAATGAAAGHFLPLPKWLRTTTAVGSCLSGVALTGYTGVLLAGTAVPIWQEGRRTLPVLFSASGAAAAAAWLELWPLNERAASTVDRFGVLAKSIELAMTVAFERAVSEVPRVALPLRNGTSATLFRGSQALTLASLVLSLLPGRRPLRIAAGVLGNLASLALRFSLIHAGRRSARDPHATFEQQRARLASDLPSVSHALEPQLGALT